MAAYLKDMEEAFALCLLALTLTSKSIPSLELAYVFRVPLYTAEQLRHPELLDSWTFHRETTIVGIVGPQYYKPL